MSLTDYSDLEKEIKDTPDPKVLPRGTEARVRIITVNEGISDKNGAQWYMPVFDIPDEPAVKEFNSFFWDLADRDKLDDKQSYTAMQNFKTFAEAIDLNLSEPFDWVEDLKGREAWAILGVKKDDYGEKNTISSWVTKK